MVTNTHVVVVDKRRDAALLLLRIAIGLLFLVHGSQKLFGMFGGDGLEGTARGLELGLGFHPGMFFAVLSGLTEFGGGLFLLFGLLTPLAGLAIVGQMIVAIITVTGPRGFFDTNGGYEFNLTLIAIALVLIIAGPGRLSLDHRLGWDIVGRLTTNRKRALTTRP